MKNQGLNYPDVFMFDWDESNINKSLLKHGVESGESEEVFYDEPIFFYDGSHSQSEDRYVAYGFTTKMRHLTIVFTLRTGKIRMISSRDQGRKEKEKYLNTKKKGGGTSDEK